MSSNDMTPQDALYALNQMVDKAGYYIIDNIEEIRPFLIISETVVPARTLRNKTIASTVQTKKLSLLTILLNFCVDDVNREYLKNELNSSQYPIAFYALIKKNTKGKEAVQSFILIKNYPDSDYLTLVCGKFSSFLIVKSILESKAKGLNYMFLNAVQGKYGVKIMTDPNTNQTLYKGKRLAQYYSGYGFELIYTEKMLCTKAGNYSASYTDMYLDRDGTYTGHIPFDEKKMSKKCRDKDIDITDYIPIDYREKMIKEWHNSIVPMALDLTKVQSSCLLNLISSATNLRNIDCRNGRTRLNELRNPKSEKFYEDDILLESYNSGKNYIPTYGKEYSTDI